MQSHEPIVEYLGTLERELNFDVRLSRQVAAKSRIICGRLLRPNRSAMKRSGSAAHWFGLANPRRLRGSTLQCRCSSNRVGPPPS